MMNGYQHLGLDERRQIYQLAVTGRSVLQISAALQRCSDIVRPSIVTSSATGISMTSQCFVAIFRPPHKQWPTGAGCVVARLPESPSLPPISPTACQQLLRPSRLRDIFDAIAVFVKPSVMRPSTCSSMGRTDEARACGAFRLLPADPDGDAMRASRAVCISPWPTPLANALPKSVIAGALVIGKAPDDLQVGIWQSQPHLAGRAPQPVYCRRPQSQAAFCRRHVGNPAPLAHAAPFPASEHHL